jgi:hypothetical protein
VMKMHVYFHPEVQRETEFGYFQDMFWCLVLMNMGKKSSCMKEYFWTIWPSSDFKESAL